VSTSTVKRVFIVGCRRSGTTWTMLLLGHHPRVVALQQVDFFRRLAHFGRWFGTRDDFGTCALTPRLVEGLPAQDTADGLKRVRIPDALPPGEAADLLRPLAEAVYDRLAAIHPAPQAVVDQTPEYVQVWEEILRVFPDAWFVHVVRDPRSVFCSQRNAARSWADPTRFSHDPASIAEEWCHDVSRARKIGEATQRYVEVHYESLRREPAKGLASILRSLELDADEALCARAVEACSLERMRSTDHAPQGFFRTGEVSGWRAEMTARELRTLEFVAGDQMRELGYEPVSPPGMAIPLGLRWRRTRQALQARIREWAWNSRSPLRRGLARALKATPGVRGLLLRRLARPDERRPAA
jgi:hypothetical protein